MEKIFRKVSQIIADKDFDALSDITITQPEKFNWARDVFEAIHVKETPDATALLWTDGNLVHQYSYCLLYTSPSPRDGLLSRMPSSA